MATRSLRYGTTHVVSVPQPAMSITSSLLSVRGSCWPCAPDSLPASDQQPELNEILGMDAGAAFALACELLAQTHPLVGAAAGLWYQSAYETSQVKSWSTRLPSSVDTGELPTQREIDDWSDRHTLGLIKRFPMELSADVTCILASALATRVSWEVPFEVVPASELAPTAWSSTLKWVLRTPHADHRHQQFLVDARRSRPCGRPSGPGQGRPAGGLRYCGGRGRRAVEGPRCCPRDCDRRSPDVREYDAHLPLRPAAW